jgi:hypothetical protein
MTERRSPPRGNSIVKKIMDIACEELRKIEEKKQEENHETQNKPS